MTLSFTNFLRRAYVALAILLIVSACGEEEACVVALKKTGVWPALGKGHAGPITMDGTIGYLPLVDGLLIADMSNPDEPTKLKIIQGYPRAMVIRDNLAYVADFAAGLKIYNIADRENPVRIGISDMGASGKALAVSGNFALLGSEGSLRVYNISDATSPQRLQDWSLNARDVKIIGGFGYAAAWRDGIKVIDFANPAGPRLAGGVAPTNGWYRSVAHKDNYLYAGANSGIHLVSLVDPLHPQIVGAIGKSTEYLQIEVVGNFLYALRIDSTFEIFDVTAAGTPVKVSEVPVRAEWFSVYGTRAYFTDSGGGLEILDLSAASEPKTVADLDGETLDVELAPPYAFLADGIGGLRVLDFSNQVYPKEVGVFREHVTQLIRQGSNIFTVCSNGHTGFVGMRILDVSDPTNPTILGSYQTATAPRIFVDGNLAYLIVRDSPLEILDVSDVRNPHQVGAYLGNTYTIAPAGSTLFVERGWRQVEIVDVSDPANPIQVGALTPTNYVMTMTVVGDLLVCAEASFELEVFQIINRTELQKLGDYRSLAKRVSGPSYMKDITMRGKFAFLSLGEDGLDIVDLSDPAQPKTAGRYLPAPEDLSATAISGDFVGLAYGRRRFELLRASEVVAERPKPAEMIKMPEPIRGPILIAKGFGYMPASQGFSILDLSDPARPAFVKKISTPEEFHMASEGDLLCIVERSPETNAVAVFSIADPKNPLLVGSFFEWMDSYVRPVVSLKLHRGRAYVAVGPDLLIFDLADPTRPALLGKYSYSPDYDIISFEVFGDTACVVIADWVKVVNVADPANPVTLGSFEDGTLYGVAKMTATAAFLMAGSKWVTLDITDRATPKASYSYQTQWEWIPGVAFAGGRLFLNEGGVQVYDLTGAEPTWVGGFWETRQLRSYLAGMTVHRNYAYVADYVFDHILTYELTSMPRMEAIKAANEITLRWPARFTNYSLYEAAQPNGPWARKAVAVENTGTHTSVSMPVIPEGAFFELRTEE